MDPNIKTEQAVIASVLERGPVPTGANADRRAGQIIRDRMKTEAPHSVHQGFAETHIEPVSELEVDRKLDGVFALRTEINVAGTARTGNRSAAERGRFTRAQQDADLAFDFTKRGYTNLTALEQGTIRTMVKNNLNTWPEAKVYLDSLGTGVDTILDSLLSEPDVTHKLNELFSGLMRGETPAVLEAARKKMQTAQARFQEAHAKLGEANLRMTTIATALNEFQEYPIGTKHQQIIDIDAPKLEAEVEMMKHKLERSDQEIENIYKQIQAIKSKTPTADISSQEARIDLLKTEADTARKEITTRQAEINKRKQLIAEREDLKRRQTELTREIADLSGNEHAADVERFMAQAELNEAELNHAPIEQAMADKLNRIFIDALRAHLAPRLQDAEKARDAMLKEEIDKAKDEPTRKFLQALSMRWDKKKTTWAGRVSTELSNKKIEDDLGVLLNQGPDAIIRNIMGDTEFDKVKGNKEYMDDARAKVAERLLQYRISNNSLTEAEARKILSEDWGQSAIAKAMERNAAVRKTIEDLKASGEVRDANHLAKLLSEHKGKLTLGGLTLASLLMLLFSPVAAAAMGGSALAASVGLAVKGIGLTGIAGATAGGMAGVASHAAREA